MEDELLIERLGRMILADHQDVSNYTNELKRLKEEIRNRILTWEYGAHINWGLIHPIDGAGVFHLDDKNKIEEVVNKRKNQNYYLSQYTSNQMERFYNRLLALDSRAVKDIVEDFVNRTYKKK